MKATPEHHLLDAGIDEQALTDYRKGVSGHERMSRSLIRAGQSVLAKTWREGRILMPALFLKLDKMVADGDAGLSTLVARMEAKEFDSIGRPRVAKPGETIPEPEAPMSVSSATIDDEEDGEEGDSDFTLKPDPAMVKLAKKQREDAKKRMAGNLKRAKETAKKASKKKVTKKKASKKKASKKKATRKKS